ncbi:hypothetical protein [Mycolicibacter hiberniae]|uniref:Uncharacterized protein n=1 Tax=Mycolicibacter hiberniae TaxID=29314 RepID=A0A7I7X8J1_9MYCO|nr:hypothetical protein [Mycolicibacter hiberniae]MCV7088340.1 hypothetical protein [Mycolicibacter hiberniae]ORV68827.1 hypothetical protein AWC09_14450 [Mycolicibacter hiberniae]BBZ25197.1 hypothetical protein MHIB_36150 [Mycolicibacter hiberniae]
MPVDAGEEQPRGHSGPPAHSSRPLPQFSRIAAWAGGTAAVLAVGLGTAALVRFPGDTSSGRRSFDAITVESAPTAVLPLSEPEILELLDRRPEYGPLADPARRAGCLTGLGYPASTPVLGAREITINGRPGVVLLLAGTAPGTINALAVAPHCSSVDTGLLADTTVRRP